MLPKNSLSTDEIWFGCIAAVRRKIGTLLMSRQDYCMAAIHYYTSRELVEASGSHWIDIIATVWGFSS
jgi:hypothetical protein